MSLKIGSQTVLNEDESKDVYFKNARNMGCDKSEAWCYAENTFLTLGNVILNERGERI